MKKKVLTIAVVGKPNAGKSTLLNHLIGQRLSIVTPKVQTTRSIVTGVVTHGETQIIILDTPGIFEPRNSLEKSMVRCAWSSLHSVDIAVVIVDVSDLRSFEDSLKIIQKIRQAKLKAVFLFNKIDLLNGDGGKQKIDKCTKLLTEGFEDSTIFHISAQTGKGINNFLDHMITQAKPDEWLYDESDMTNLPMRFIASEFTREQLFLQLSQELPYKLTVETESYKLEDGAIKINQVIIVERESQKSIILGAKGARIKEVGIKARQRIEEFLGEKVHLFLFVKVRKNWDENPHNYSYMGIKYEKF